MIPVMIPVRGHVAGSMKPGTSRPTGYGLRVLLVVGLLGLLGGLFAILWTGVPRSRRLPSTFLESFTPQPILAGALAGIGADPGYQLSSTEGTTLWWRRRYQERAYLITTSLSGPEVTPFLTAVRDSIEQRLLAHGATRRGLQSIAWPDSGSVAEPRGPALVSMPYSTRRRVGWVTIQAARVESGRLAMGLLIHEGPKPSE